MAKKSLSEILCGRVQFGDYGVIGEGEYNPKSRMAKCVCKCGRVRQVACDKLRSGRSTCCSDCAKSSAKRAASTSHGMSGSSEYKAWLSMKARCYRKANSNYANYGGRGISVCARWLDSFDDFYADMGSSNGLTLERIDVNGGYEPNNCRWASRVEQQANRRTTLKVDDFGVAKVVSIEARRVGMLPATLAYRLRRGMRLTAAVSKPVECRRPMHIVKGELMTASDILNRYCIPRGRLNYNLRKGMTADEVVAMYERNGRYDPSS